MSLNPEHDGFAEKHANNTAPPYEPGTLGEHKPSYYDNDPVVAATTNKLHQDLKGRHMQMIAMQVQPSKSSSVY